MFTIEHNFDATVITLIDGVAARREEDVRVTLSDSGVIAEQIDVDSGEMKKIKLSNSQLSDLLASVNLPEGAYTDKI